MTSSFLLSRLNSSCLLSRLNSAPAIALEADLIRLAIVVRAVMHPACAIANRVVSLPRDCFYVKPLSGIQTPPIAGRAGFRRAQESRRSSRKPRFLPDHPSGHASALGAIQWEKPSILQEEQHVNDNVNFYAGGARGAVTLREHIQLHAEYTPIDRI